MISFIEHCLKSQNYRQKNRSMIARARGGESGLTAEEHLRTFWSDGNILYLDLVMII